VIYNNLFPLKTIISRRDRYIFVQYAMWLLIVQINGGVMIIKREIEPRLKSLAQQFPAVAVMGPRQSGKTTLAKQVFTDYAYVSLEDLDKKFAAKQDPRGFLAHYYDHAAGVIIDEIQEVPELFSYLQGFIDRAYRPGFFILTGSQHFLIHEKITQTLAGRIALLTLLPLTVSELQDAGLLPATPEETLLKGFYPRLYAQPIEVTVWQQNYVSTYVEKDVRQVLQISDVMLFQRFLKICAARIGNIINYADLARDCDISPNTAKAWLSVLEASFIITLLQPYHKNFSKRLIKSPKLYFYDSALACFLLGIKTVDDIVLHPLKGALFESFSITEMLKYSYNRAELPRCFFWRDIQGHEIDCVIETAFDSVIPVEIKAGKTVAPAFYKGLRDWAKITEQNELVAHVLYAGQEGFAGEYGQLWSWHAVRQMMQQIYGNKK
jgi:predicted AAA+ superfamily ATPase